MHRKERYVGRLHRFITIPSLVSNEDVQAYYKNGVLEIRLPRLVKNDKKDFIKLIKEAGKFIPDFPFLMANE